MTSQFSDITSTSKFLVGRCFVSRVKFSSSRSFFSISSLVLELWQFFFIRDWPEIRKSEIPQSEFFQIYKDCGKLWVPNLARMCLIECYWSLQNFSVTAFTILELLRENQLGGEGVKLPPSPIPTQIRVNAV